MAVNLVFQPSIEINYNIKFPDRDLSANDPVSSHPSPHPTRPHSTHLLLRLCDDVSFFYGSIAVFGVFYSISLWEVALFLSER
jgi:hypothetical protein